MPAIFRILVHSRPGLQLANAAHALAAESEAGALRLYLACTVLASGMSVLGKVGG